MKKFILISIILMIMTMPASCGKKDEISVGSGEITATDEMRTNSVVHEGDMSRLQKAFLKAEKENEITIAFIGGSITYGSGGAGGETYVKIVEKWFKENFPGADVVSVNAGISGTDSVLGIHRLRKDVLDFNPDIIIVEFAVNDGVDSNGNLYNIEQSYAYENIVREIMNTPQQAAVLPLFCAVEGGYNSQKDKITTGLHYDLPMVSYLNAIMPEIQSGSLQWSDITKDGIHPNKTGHRILGALVTNLLDIAMSKTDERFGIPVLPEPLTEAYYTDADILFSGDSAVLEIGDFEAGTFHWIYKNGWNASDSKEAMIIEIECKSLQILVNKTTDDHGAFFNISVDGTDFIRITTKSENGYEMLESDIIFRYESIGFHRITIQKSLETPEWCDGENDEILGILVSK